MSPRATNARPQPDAIYTSWTSFATVVDGMDISVREGQRLRGDAAVVKQCPGQFVPDGTPQNEWPSAFASVEERSAARVEAEAAQAKMDVHVSVRPETFEKVDLVVLMEPIRLGVGHGSNGSLPLEYLTLEKGTLVAANDPLVGAKPGAFAELQWEPKRKKAA